MDRVNRFRVLRVCRSVGHKTELLRRCQLTPLTITEGAGLATAQQQQHRVYTIFVAAVPSGQGLSCLVCRAIGSMVLSKQVPCAPFVHPLISRAA